MNKFETMIDEIESYLNTCKSAKLSKNHIMVEKAVLESMLRELRLAAPNEIKKYQAVINNKEAILSDARKQAHDLINEAKTHRNELIDEHEVMRQAYEQANEVVKSAAGQAQELVERASGELDRAKQEATNLQLLAVNYTDQLLQESEALIQKSIDAISKHNEQLNSELAALCETVRFNRTQLAPPQTLEEEAQPKEPAGEEAKKEGAKGAAFAEAQEAKQKQEQNQVKKD